MAYPYNTLTDEDAAYIRSVTEDKRVYTGEDINEDYTHDEFKEYGTYMPDLVVEVVNTEEVSRIMAYAHEKNIPVTVRGAGTGLAGGAVCKYGGILLSTMKMNHIFPVDLKNQTITVEPGAYIIDIQEAAGEAGLFYPPDPGQKYATIGGNVATNAGGMKAVRYGLTRDFVRCIEAVLPDGRIQEFSSNVVKNTTGYDLKDLIIGSEGTLAIITQITLKLMPRPIINATLVIPFNTLEECADMVPKLIALPFIPTAIEFMERDLVDLTAEKMDKHLPVNEGGAVLLVMYDAATQYELDSAVEMAAKAAEDNKALNVFVADTPASQAQVWGMRAAILEAMQKDCVSMEECDIVVPKADLVEYVHEARKICERLGLRLIPCGHCGDGNVHTMILRGNDISDEQWESTAKVAVHEIDMLAKRLKGQMSGEHGVGHGRITRLEDFVGPTIIELYKSIKLAFDPQLVLNPGKIVEFNEHRKNG